MQKSSNFFFCTILVFFFGPPCVNCLNGVVESGFHYLHIEEGK